MCQGLNFNIDLIEKMHPTTKVNRIMNTLDTPGTADIDAARAHDNDNPLLDLLMPRLEEDAFLASLNANPYLTKLRQRLHWDWLSHTDIDNLTAN